jgi:protein-disulfide isomerase
MANMNKIKVIFTIFTILFYTPLFANDNFPYYGTKETQPKVKIEVYSSLTCPHCANFHLNVLPKLVEKFSQTNKVLIELRDYPLDLAALKAAQIARCVTTDMQKKYLDDIYKNQSQWTKAKTLNDLYKNIENISGQYGLKGEDFQNCLKNKKEENSVLQSRIDAQKIYSIDSTPTLIINKKKYNGSWNDLEKYINNLL